MNAPKCEICENFIYATAAKDEKGFDYHPNCLRKKRGAIIIMKKCITGQGWIIP